MKSFVSLAGWVSLMAIHIGEKHDRAEQRILDTSPWSHTTLYTKKIYYLYKKLFYIFTLRVMNETTPLSPDQQAMLDKGYPETKEHFTKAQARALSKVIRGQKKIAQVKQEIADILTKHNLSFDEVEQYKRSQLRRRVGSRFLPRESNRA